MKFAVDRIEDNIVVLENIETKEKKEIDRITLPSDIQDGTIIKVDNGTYVVDNSCEVSRRKLIREKMERLKRLKSKKNV